MNNNMLVDKNENETINTLVLDAISIDNKDKNLYLSIASCLVAMANRTVRGVKYSKNS